MEISVVPTSCPGNTLLFCAQGWHDKLAQEQLANVALSTCKC